jgi:hypothetical protein
MSAKRPELESMALDDLWSLHKRITEILSARIKAEKGELGRVLISLSLQLRTRRGPLHPRRRTCEARLVMSA